MKPTYIYTGSDKLVSYVEKKYKSQGASKMKVENIKTKSGHKMAKYQFNTFDELEAYFIDNFDRFKKENLKTKVVGKVLLTF